MIESSRNHEFELRMSPKPVIALQVAAGLALAFVGDTMLVPSDQFKARLFVLLFYAVSAIAWLFDRWRPWGGRWFTVLGLVAIVQLGHNWLGVPGFLTLMVIPTALAAALVSVPGAAATAVGETVLLVLLAKSGAGGAHLGPIITTLIAIWGTLGVMAAVYRPVHQLSSWSWEHFQRTQGLLEEARDRKAELEQVLDDLAHANQQLALANERLGAMRLIAEEAQRTKAAFVAKVSHEFRTPLNMIIGLVDLLAETPEIYGQELPPALWQDLEIVHRNCEHLSSMINDVLDLSQIEEGRLMLHRERVDLADVISGALTIVRPLLAVCRREAP